MREIDIGPVRGGLRAISYSPTYLHTLTIGSIFTPVKFKKHREGNLLYVELAPYPALRAMIERFEDALVEQGVYLTKVSTSVDVEFTTRYARTLSLTPYMSITLALPADIPLTVTTRYKVVLSLVDAKTVYANGGDPSPAERAIYERLDSLEAKLDAFVNAVNELKDLR